MRCCYVPPCCRTIAIPDALAVAAADAAVWVLNSVADTNDSATASAMILATAVADTFAVAVALALASMSLTPMLLQSLLPLLFVDSPQ